MRNNLFITVILSATILIVCPVLEAADSIIPQVIINENKLHISQTDIERVKKEAEHALDSICPILGIKKQPITINIINTGICYASRGEIFLPIRHIEAKNAAIVHEISHIITRHNNNYFFSEGLAIYFQERFGEDHGFPNFLGVPLDDLVRRHEDKLYEIDKLAYDNNIFTQVGTKQREIAYIQAGSFINFLVITFGEKKLVELHNSRLIDYKTVYGKDIKELGIEWKNNVLKK
jgi:hypothetical protein